MQIFGGSSNQELAGKIARIVGVQLGEIEISQFAGGETRVWVKEGKIEKSVVLVQSLSIPTNEHLMEFCLICDSLRRGGATEITAVIAWMGYSKQDKVFRAGEPLSAKVVAQIIQTTKIKKLITFDLHNRAITGFFDIPVVELSAKPIFLEYFRQTVEEDTIVVAPDAGAVKASVYFARELSVPIAYMDKRRDLKTGQVEVVGMSGEVAGKRAIIVDDMIVTGSTMMETAKYLKKKGAKSVSVAATHHLYVPGVQEKLEKSEIDEMVVSDTVLQISESANQRISKKLKVLSVAEMITKEI